MNPKPIEVEHLSYGSADEPLMASLALLIKHENDPGFTFGPDFKDLLPDYVVSIKHYYSTSSRTVFAIKYPAYMKWAGGKVVAITREERKSEGFDAQSPQRIAQRLSDLLNCPSVINPFLPE